MLRQNTVDNYRIANDADELLGEVLFLVHHLEPPLCVATRTQVDLLEEILQLRRFSSTIATAATAAKIGASINSRPRLDDIFVFEKKTAVLILENVQRTCFSRAHAGRRECNFA